MALSAPDRIWWKPVGRQERLWVGVSLGFLIILFLSMPLWHLLEKQNTPGEFYRVSSAQFSKLVTDFNAAYKVGEEAAGRQRLPGRPAVALVIDPGAAAGQDLSHPHLVPGRQPRPLHPADRHELPARPRLRPGADPDPDHDR